MIVVLAILAATRASSVGYRSAPLVSRDQFEAVPCDDPQGHRSLWDIIWSCAVTILLCTWVSVHPNIPSPDERWPRVTLRRIGLMLAALFVPEAMIAWALRQRLAAAKLAKEHKREGWTLTHGFFAVMGGFMEYEGSKPIRVLLPEQLESYSLMGNGNFPRIAKAEIDDKNKGDVISKMLVILQTGWFITQCIARSIQELPVTELELVTVAFATLNFAMYVLWWDKPLNVQRAVRVYKKLSPEQHTDDWDDEVEATSTVGFWGALRDGLSGVPAAISLGPFIADPDVHDEPWLLRVVMWPLVKPTHILYGRIAEHETRIATFYPDDWVTDRMNFAMIIVATVALAFGGIHCIGWTFTFPSSLERTLWRVASVSITTIPVLLLLLVFASSYLQLEGKAWNTILMPPLFLYMLSRVALLILPFLSLRSLPPAAYHIIHWLSFIPHV
ncbi:hypothetical protein F5148DRAFT_992934 [Russula earlei]|uniref:Uncharacterized protein n=1 Tax=Russula earlei TaxID=71964 RepID=A0ACC0ULT4_9AGAM|nr:hypothetical protein F5148DRAFT_992934 [Russula earlei]